MRDAISIPAVPIEPNCLSWSSDGEIALCTGDTVQVLVSPSSPSNCSTDAPSKLPNVTSPTSPAPFNTIWTTDQPDTPAPWTRVVLPTALFTQSEFPQRLPLGTPAFSLGEEISGALALSAVWSPPGLGAHARCVLAVHTTNLLLSIWAPRRPPAGSSASWARLVVANHALEEAGVRRRRTKRGEGEGRRGERVRCFAWAPLVGGGMRGVQEEVFLVAVANDEREVVVLEMRSPYSRMWDAGEWGVEVRARITVGEEERAEPGLEWTFEDYVRCPNHVASMAWSPWVAGDERSVVSLIACATAKGIEFVRAVQSASGSDIELEKVDLMVPMAAEHSPGGLLKFDSLVDGSTVTLVADLADELVCCAIDVTDPKHTKLKRLARPEWGDVSGEHSLEECRANI
jgi:hypothetical protein